MSSVFDEVSPYIEYVDPIFKNPSDIQKIKFKCKGNPTNVLKWCRRNFGQRGDGWDFVGGWKNAEIIIWSSKLITMYELFRNE